MRTMKQDILWVFICKEHSSSKYKPEYADDYENTMVSFAGHINERLEQDGKVFVKLAESAHKIKKGRTRSLYACLG